MPQDIFDQISTIMSVIVIFAVFWTWPHMRRVNMDVLRARMFLDKKFLRNNWILLSCAIIFLGLHTLITSSKYLQYLMIGELFELLSAFAITLLLVQWIRIIRSCE